MNTHVASVASNVGMIYKKLSPYIRHADQTQRRLILTAKLEAVALYASPLLFNESEVVQKRFENIVMRI